MYFIQLPVPNERLLDVRLSFSPGAGTKLVFVADSECGLEDAIFELKEIVDAAVRRLREGNLHKI